MSHELKLICVMAGVLLALGVMCIREWMMYRAERQLDAEVWMHRGVKKVKHFGLLPKDDTH